MSEKSAPGGKWANPALLEALAMGFHTVAKGEGLTKEAKDAVILKMHAYGFTDITWEAVRCVSPSCLLFHPGGCLFPRLALPLFVSHSGLMRFFLSLSFISHTQHISHQTLSTVHLLTYHHHIVSIHFSYSTLKHVSLNDPLDG